MTNFKIMIKSLFPKVKNPLVEDTFYNRFNEWLCGKNFKSCIRYGSYYGMAQGSCRRCGHKNKGLASEDVPEWQLPNRLQPLSKTLLTEPIFQKENLFKLKLSGESDKDFWNVLYSTDGGKKWSDIKMHMQLHKSLGPKLETNELFNFYVSSNASTDKLTEIKEKFSTLEKVMEFENQERIKYNLAKTDRKNRLQQIQQKKEDKIKQFNGK